jgi:electron transport complex protein RnfC
LFVEGGRSLSPRSFTGGLHPAERKDATAGRPIETIAPPAEVIVHLHQHTGAPCKPIVAKGEKVAAGQKVGDVEAFVTAPVHSPISGEVVAVEPRLHFTGVAIMAVVIKGDGEGRETRIETPSGKEPTPDEVRKIVREAGIVGLGGAAFPTHVKLSPPKEKPIETVILNGCECEPYLTCDHRTMLERAEAICDGLSIMAAAVGAKRAVIGVEENKPDAIVALRKAAPGGVEVVALPTKYPQGAEKQLIKVLTGRTIPSGKLPMDVAALVQNVGTAVAVSEAVREGKALTSRPITVSGGAVREPKNLQVLIGTPLSLLVTACGGASSDPVRIVVGGPMTGFAQFSLDAPTVKGTGGLLLLDEVEAAPGAGREMPCIRCGRCVAACPMLLMPSQLGTYARIARWDDVERFDVLDCIECGCCGYVCPSRIPLVQLFRLGKAKVLAARAQRK